MCQSGDIRSVSLNSQKHCIKMTWCSVVRNYIASKVSKDVYFGLKHIYETLVM